LPTYTGDALSNNILSTVALLVGGAPAVLAGLWLDWPPEVQGVQNWGIIAANGIVGIAIALSVFNYILRTLRSYEASILASSGIIFMAVTACFILGERLDGDQIFGIVMMLLGLALVQIRHNTNA
jgi:drug/metabolite transporter (DMT)-like permease